MRRLKWLRTVSSLSIVLLLEPGSGAQTWYQQVDLTLAGRAPMPANGKSASRSIAARKQATVSFLACGNELDFLSKLRAGDSGEDQFTHLVAKMYWAAGLPDSTGNPTLGIIDRPSFVAPECEQTALVSRQQGVPADDVTPPAHDPGAIVKYDDELNRMKDLNDQAIRGANLNAVFSRLFGDSCDNVIQKVTFDAATSVYTIKYRIPPSCMRAEFNYGISQTHVTGQMGTDKGMPCHLFSTLKDGDANWDMSSKLIIRGLYLDRLFLRRNNIELLTPEVRAYMRQKLIIAEKDLGEPSYPVTACGDSEHATGDAQHRVDDSNFFEDVGKAFGDFFNWLIKHWYVLTPTLFLIQPAAETLLQELWVGGLIADALDQSTRIPESENHRLMIESTRYLNNQLTRADLEGDSDRLESLNDAQSDVHDWLLERMQDILANDFIEFNARPYQRDSLDALMNLYDFAEDAEISTAAQMVLEYAFAKFAVGSNQGRRLVPFRRHMSDVEDPIEKIDPEDGNYGNVLYTAKEADHQVALGLLYTGQTQQLRMPGSLTAFAPDVFGVEAGLASVSWYQPHEMVLDLAIDKSTPYFQRYHHAGMEAYASGKGYLITAGGVVTDPAYTVLGFGSTDDMGAAVPISVMFPSGTGKGKLWSWLLIQGMRYRVRDHLGADYKPSYNHNTCVTKGFACGLNLYVPGDMVNCFVAGPAEREPRWWFFNSTTCPAYSEGPPVYMVLYQDACILQGGAEPNCKTMGFVEPVDQTAPTPASFAAFMADTLKRNPPGLLHLSGTSVYNTADGRKIEFDPLAWAADSNKTGIRSIDGTPQSGWDDWPAADGVFYDAASTPLITNTSGPVVTIRNPRYPLSVIMMNFADKKSPKYVAP